MRSFRYSDEDRASAWLPDAEGLGTVVPGMLGAEGDGPLGIVLTEDFEEHEVALDLGGARAIALPLFVYGTLMSGEAEHGRIDGLGARRATISGSLLALPAGYPGAIAGAGTIHGELIDVRRGWAELDAYEGFVGYGKASLFRRVVVRSSVLAWTYVYAGPIEGANVIASGDWKRARLEG